MLLSSFSQVPNGDIIRIDGIKHVLHTIPSRNFSATPFRKWCGTTHYFMKEIDAWLKWLTNINDVWLFLEKHT